MMEVCEKCGGKNDPVYSAVKIDYKGHKLSINYQRYKCSCGWIWANKEQRKFNNTLFDNALEDLRYGES